MPNLCLLRRTVINRHLITPRICYARRSRYTHALLLAAADSLTWSWTS